jgi:regulatory protein
MKIEKLTPSGKVADRYYAQFEDGSGMTVSIALIADFSLYTGRDLDEDELEALRTASRTASSKARALRILGKRNMSRSELTERLVSKGENEDTAQETADWLERIGAINDEEYAALIVRHYASNGYGRGRIKDELYRRGIGRDLWEDALAGLTEQDETLYKMISSKLKGEKPDRKELKRVTDGLCRRGFSWEEIKAAVERYLSETD